MGLDELFHRVFSDRLTWAVGLVFGVLSALVDLHSATRWPHILLLCLFALILTSWQPKYAWRWTLLVALCLPVFVLVTDNWGPYSIDRFDVFYGLVPATFGTLAGLALPRLLSSLMHRSGTHIT